MSTDIARPLQRHIVIRASAGAGKTFELSSRYLRLLCQDAPPQTILAITFTRKAAGEILGRVLTRLARASQSQQAARDLASQLGEEGLSLPGVRQMLGRLCESLHRVSISTIDSFFNSVVRAFGAELGVPPGLTLVGEGDPLARQLRIEAIDALLADDELDTLIDLLRRLHHDEARRSVTEAIETVVRELYEVYRLTDAAAWHALQLPPDELPARELVGAINALAGIEPLVAAQKSWAKAWGKDLAAVQMHDWLGFVATGIAAKVAAGQDTYVTKAPLPAAVIDAYRPLVAHVRATLVARAARRTQAMFGLIDRFHRHYQRLRREHAIMLFGDLPALLSHGLPAPDGEDGCSDLYYRLDHRVQHLLLDEFQDTSPSQWHVLEPIAAEISAWGDPDSLERTFFCVGDTKQAIYGWRGGSAAIFDRVEHDLHLSPEGAQRRSGSWRSSPVVLDVVNRVFGRIAQLPPMQPLREHVEAWQQGFDQHTAMKPDLPGCVEMVTTRLDDEVDEAGDDGGEQAMVCSAHERYVAARIAELAMRYAGRSIGVLVRRNSVANHLIHELRELGVEVSGEGGAVLVDDAAVLAMLAALQLSDHPGDTAAAFHVVNSPLGDVVGLMSIEENESARVGRAIRRRLIDEGFAGVLTDWARQIAPSCGPRNVRRLTQLIELADAYDVTRSLRARDFIDYVRATAVESPSAAQVRVMTVHKAKGLEFDAVVLAELEGRMGDVARQQVWTLRSHETQPPMAVFASVRKDMLPLVEAYDPRVAEAREQEKARRLHDDLCSLYVALTRPRHALHLFVKPVRQNSSGPGTTGVHDASGAAVLRHALTDVNDPDSLVAEQRVVFSDGDLHWHERLPIADVKSTAAPRPPHAILAKPQAASGRSWVTVSPSSLEASGTVAAAELLRLTDNPAMARGSAIHALFERIEWIEDYAPVDDDEPFAADFAAMLQHADVRVALSRNGRHGVELWRERAFAVRLKDRLVQGTFDRVEIDRPRKRARIIDFKTDRHSDAAVDRYRPQIDAYRAAVATMLGWNADAIEAVLVFVGDGRVVRL